MKTSVFTNISKIIERDSKTSTYKFALLRGVIDIIQDNSPYITFSDGRAHFPTGLLMEKWMLYYYPLLESPIGLPQINGNTRLAFEEQFRTIIYAYSEQNGFSGFYNDLRNKGIPISLIAPFLALCNKLYHTITQMPMRYIGRSISNEYYSLFSYQRATPKRKPAWLDIGYLISNYGSFSIPHEYYDAFKVLGSFINGQDSILFKWAEFSVRASGATIPVEKVLGEVLKGPVTEREVNESKKLYKDVLKMEGSVFCVWSGTRLSKYEIDHVIPFSVWKSNDLWNLLPSSPKINNTKRDKIPSPALIETRKDMILHYWQLLNKHLTSRFRKELQIALLGDAINANWETMAIARLKSGCDHLISERGYEEWKI
jgi:hypothetical protein